MQTTLPFINTDHSCDSFEMILFNRNEKRFTVELNSRMTKSWRITKRGSIYIASVPALFNDAPFETKCAMIRWAEILVSSHLSRSKLKQECRTELSDIEKELWTFLKGDAELIRMRQVHQPDKHFRHTFGLKFDLKVQFDQLNDRYFEDQLKSFLRWGQHGSRTSYHTIITDESKEQHHLITIAGLYNHPATPEFALNGVLYHEMLHIAYPPKGGIIRRNVHHREFRQREKEFHHFDKWQTWLRTDAAKLLRQMRHG